MNSEQLRLFISGAFGSEADAKRVTKLLTPYLARSLQEIRDIVELLPTESLRRQAVWRELEPQIAIALGPYNDAFFVELERQLPLSGAGAAQETIDMMRSVGVPMGGVIPPELVMADSTKYLLNTKINNKSLINLFAPTADGGVSPFIKSNLRTVQRLVVGGIIRGDETKVIAAKLIPQLRKGMAGQALAIARTSIQDFNRQVKEEVWEQNRDALRGLQYEWVAALDSRTCPTCGVLDGVTHEKKSSFSVNTPVHVNCRCSIVLVDPEDKGRIRYGQLASEKQFVGDDAYKTKKRVKGEDLYRKTTVVPVKADGDSPRYGDFLADANPKTQQMFFGGGKLGEERAARFNRFIKRGMKPETALGKLVSVPDKKGIRKFSD